MQQGRTSPAGAIALGRALRSRWRQSFVASATLLALLGVGLMAIVVSRVAGQQIRDDALDRATERAQIVARSSFAPRLPAQGQPLSKSAMAELDAQQRAARESEPGAGTRLWARNGQLLYPAGAAGATPSAPVRSAFAGSGGSRREGGRLVTAVPVARNGGSAPAAVLELSLPYAATQKDVNDRTRRLQLALVAAAIALYLLFLPALIRAGRAVRSYYDPRRVALLRDLKQAIARGELRLAFQPIADARSGEVRTAEALIRWYHPERGKIPPDRFIPQAEGTEAMGPLTLHVFELALTQVAAWRDKGLDLRVAVNVSAAGLLDRDLPGHISAIASKLGVWPSPLEVEITEGAVMEYPAFATEVLGELAALGLGVVAIDDFGTGYSSLARLHELPLDTLKIDQSFVRRMSIDGDETVVRSIIELAHALHLGVIAEGVEDDDTWGRLRALGADYIQGYGLSQPLPAQEFVEWLARREHALPA
jgi:EAL domain-containing protein (putative c-di-GMP-specific phosphodiesterase class I)